MFNYYNINLFINNNNYNYNNNYNNNNNRLQMIENKGISIVKKIQ